MIVFFFSICAQLRYESGLEFQEVWPSAAVSSFLLSASYQHDWLEIGTAAMFVASFRGQFPHGAMLAWGHVLILSGSLPAVVEPQSNHCGLIPSDSSN